MITRMHSATVIVADQDAALDFYVNRLGFDKLLDEPMGDGVRFITVAPRGAATQLALGPATWAPPGGPHRETGITFVSPDIDATYETLTAQGVRFKDPVAVMPWGQKAAWFYDLDGNEFYLVEQA